MKDPDLLSPASQTQTASQTQGNFHQDPTSSIPLFSVLSVPTPADVQPPRPEGIHHFHNQIANQKYPQPEDGIFQVSYDSRQASEHRK